MWIQIEDDLIAPVNAEGYTDRTASRALANIMKVNRNSSTEIRVNILHRLLRLIAQLSGFQMSSRFMLKDITTGRIFNCSLNNSDTGANQGNKTGQVSN